VSFLLLTRGIGKGVAKDPNNGVDPASTADDHAAFLLQNSELRARVEARDQRIRLLEEALRVLRPPLGATRNRIDHVLQDRTDNELPTQRIGKS
jgi:hypothetical protein